jgi:4-amino-4-deoxy-L-arabinose transferase-like glycosyltransferase
MRDFPLRDPARRVVVLIAVATFALHIAFASRYGWFRDELYYVACARRLAWGYVDHPPMVAVIARLALALFGDSLVGLRAFAALAAALTAVLAGEIARAMGGERFAQGLAAFAAAASGYDLVVGQIYTMNVFEPLVWGAVALVFAHAARGRTRALLWLGPIVGLGILNKHSAAWPVAGLLLGVALSPSRRLLVRKETLIATATAALIVAPHVAWQVANGFPTREFARSALSGKNEPYGVLAFVWQEILLAHPVAAPLWMGGLAALIAWKPLHPFRPLAVVYLFVAALIVATQAKAYYLAPAFGWLFAAGAVTFEQVTVARLRWTRVAFPAVLGATAAILLPVAVPILDETTFQRYSAALGIFGEARSGEKVKPAALPQLYADMHGWPEMARVVAGVVDSLPADERGSSAVLADNYGEASAVEMFARLPVASGNNGWWLWGPPRGTGPMGWPRAIVTIGYDEDELTPWFGEVREAARADHPLARGEERDLPIYVCRAPLLSIDTAWPRIKHYR